MKIKSAVVALITLTLAACATGQTAHAGFEYLHTGRGFIESANVLKVRVSGDRMRVVGSESRRDTFHGHPYQISLAALVDGDVAVLVHAEHVADGSGASNYEDLPVAEWPTDEFRTRRSCVTLAREDISGEHDLEWLQASGYDPIGPLVLDQSFLTTADHNNEVVVSVMVKGVNCDNADIVERALSAARARLDVTIAQ